MKFRLSLVILFIFGVGLLAAYLLTTPWIESVVTKEMATIKSVEEIQKLYGKPYYVDGAVPDEWCGVLLNQGDSLQDRSIQAFVVNKMPPIFLVVKIDRKTNRVMNWRIVES